MTEDKKPPTSRELDREIQRLKDDVASLKARFATPPQSELEEALAALAIARQHPLNPQQLGDLYCEIQQFKDEINTLKGQLASHEQKLPKGRGPDGSSGDD